MAKCSESPENQAMNVLFPMWFKAAVAGVCTVITAGVLGAAGWAFNMNATVTEMSVELKALNAITAERFASLKERLDRERREDDRRRPVSN